MIIYSIWRITRDNLWFFLVTYTSFGFSKLSTHTVHQIEKAILLRFVGRLLKIFWQSSVKRTSTEPTKWLVQKRHQSLSIITDDCILFQRACKAISSRSLLHKMCLCMVSKLRLPICYMNFKIYWLLVKSCIGKGERGWGIELKSIWIFAMISLCAIFWSWIQEPGNNGTVCNNKCKTVL